MTTEPQEQPATTEDAPATRLIDQKHAEGSATALAIIAVNQFQKDYDGYLLHMLQQKIPGRQAELLYKKIATELGVLLSVDQKKTIAKEIFEGHDLTTPEGVEAALSALSLKIDLSKNAMRNWMKKYAEVKKITLAKTSRVSTGVSSKTSEIFAFIISGHKANQPKEKIIQVTMDKFGLKGSTAKTRYAAVAKEQGWNITPEDNAMRSYALVNARTVTKVQLQAHSPKASTSAINQVAYAVKFFQESLIVIAAEEAEMRAQDAA